MIYNIDKIINNIRRSDEPIAPKIDEKRVYQLHTILMNYYLRKIIRLANDIIIIYNEVVEKKLNFTSYNEIIHYTDLSVSYRCMDVLSDNYMRNYIRMTESFYPEDITLRANVFKDKLIIFYGESYSTYSFNTDYLCYDKSSFVDIHQVYICLKSYMKKIIETYSKGNK